MIVGGTGGEGSIEYLTLDELRAWYDVRIRAGTHVVGRADLVEVAVYRRPEAYYVLPVVAHPNGGGLERRDLEPSILGTTMPADRLGQAMMSLLAEPETSKPGPVPRRPPILRAAKLSSWRQLIRSAESVSVSRQGDRYTVHPWVRDVTRLDDYQLPAPDAHAQLDRPSARQLGEAIVRACDLIAS